MRLFVRTLEEENGKWDESPLVSELYRQRLAADPDLAEMAERAAVAAAAPSQPPTDRREAESITSIERSLSSTSSAESRERETAAKEKAVADEKEETQQKEEVAEASERKLSLEETVEAMLSEKLKQWKADFVTREAFEAERRARLELEEKAKALEARVAQLEHRGFWRIFG